MASTNQHKIPRPYESTGALLQEYRLKSDHTQKEIAEALRYSSAQFISNFENGITSLPAKKASKILKMIGLPLEKYLSVYGKEDLAHQKNMILAKSK